MVLLKYQKVNGIVQSVPILSHIRSTTETAVMLGRYAKHRVVNCVPLVMVHSNGPITMVSVVVVQII